MRKLLPKLIIVGISSFSLVTYARAPGTYFQVKTELEKISQNNLIESLNTFVKKSAPSRMVGRPGHDLAKLFIEEEIARYDKKKSGTFKVETFTPDVLEAQRFYQSDFDQKIEGKLAKTSADYKKWLKFTQNMQNMAQKYKDFQGQNLVWEKAGIDSSKLLIITAHYDTATHDPNTFLLNEDSPMPGANYNASGVIVALSLIKVLAEIDLNYSVRVVFLDWQGIGFLGSFDYAKKLAALSQKSLGIINLEMLGQDSSYLDKTKKLGNMSLYLRQNASEEAFARELQNHGQKITTKVNFEAKANGFESSDNIRFWEKNLTCVTFSQNWEDDFNPKFYQSSLDTPETLNHETLYHVYQFIGGAVLGRLLDITK